MYGLESIIKNIYSVPPTPLEFKTVFLLKSSLITMESVVPQKRTLEDTLEEGEQVQDGYITDDSSYDDQSVTINPSSMNGFHKDTRWQKTVERVVQSVVSIHFSQVVNFDSEQAEVSEATGFVVDEKLGIILTNRHVVGAGPFFGYALFDNHEEVEVKPIYRDPVHDFGFLKFNPKDIKYMEVKELKLRPELAKVGCEIRVIGNDDGEKLSILAGFISRLDRNAPDYGANTYNDFNTEYIQAAASASGGSSGSPVVNIDGLAVALQAGGSTNSSTDFFLPLHRVHRALQCIQGGNPVTRGTIQVQWLLEPFDTCRRLGLSNDVEDNMRKSFPNANGMLVAEVILPEGPADSKIKEGDCLISINGQLISTFITVDDILDSSIGNEVEVVVQRGGENMSVKCEVGDLHSITPSTYLSVAGITFNDLSYQMARIFSIPVRGVFINNSGSFFDSTNKVTSGWIVDSVNDKETPDMESFIEVMKQIPDRSFAQFQYHHISNLHVPFFKLIPIDRHWSKEIRLATRNDISGLWDFETLQEEPLPAVPSKPLAAKFSSIPTEFEGCRNLDRNFAMVNSYMPIPVDSCTDTHKIMYGVIIDAENGYVLVSQACIPHDLIDVDLTIAESVVIGAKVKFLHPSKGYAILKYDPSLVVSDINTPRFATKPLTRGDKAVFIAYNRNLRIVVDETKVRDVCGVNIKDNNSTPKNKATNIEAIMIDSNLSVSCRSGVIADYDGTIRAFWLNFEQEESEYSLAIDATDIMYELESLKRGVVPNIRVIDSEIVCISIFLARSNGVPEEYISKLEDQSIDRVQFLRVAKTGVDEFGKLASELKPGDIILSANGNLISRLRDLDDALSKAESKESLTFKVVRKRKVIDIQASTLPINTFNTDHIVIWAGAILQAPHHGVRQCITNLPSAVYCTAMTQGSPSKMYTIGVTNFITHVNEKPTPDLDTFVKVVKDIEDNSYCKIRIVTFDNVPMASTLKVNYHYFPTAEFKRDAVSCEWQKID